MDDKELYSGLVRLHILRSAVKEAIFGLGIIEKLAKHGYKLSSGTLYPILQDMEKKDTHPRLKTLVYLTHVNFIELPG